MGSAKREEVKEWVRYRFVGGDVDDGGYVSMVESEVVKGAKAATGYSDYIVRASLEEMRGDDVWVQYDAARMASCVYMNIYTDVYEQAVKSKAKFHAGVLAAWKARKDWRESKCGLAKRHMARVERVFKRFGVTAKTSVYTAPRNTDAGKAVIRFDDPETLSALADILERI
jgi:hypothetical protein